jgi:hypothetical protein
MEAAMRSVSQVGSGGSMDLLKALPWISGLAHEIDRKIATRGIH